MSSPSKDARRHRRGRPNKQRRLGEVKDDTLDPDGWRRLLSDPDSLAQYKAQCIPARDMREDDPDMWKQEGISGLDKKIVDAMEVNPLVRLACLGDTASLSVLVTEFGFDADSVGSLGVGPLHAAAAFGHADTITGLVGMGANPHGRDVQGYNALHASVVFKKLGSMKALMEATASPESLIMTVAADLKLPLMLAIEQEFYEGLELMLESIKELRAIDVFDLGEVFEALGNLYMQKRSRGKKDFATYILKLVRCFKSPVEPFQLLPSEEISALVLEDSFRRGDEFMRSILTPDAYFSLADELAMDQFMHALFSYIRRVGVKPQGRLEISAPLFKSILETCSMALLNPETGNSLGTDLVHHNVVAWTSSLEIREVIRNHLLRSGKRIVYGFFDEQVDYDLFVSVSKAYFSVLVLHGLPTPVEFEELWTLLFDALELVDRNVLGENRFACLINVYFLYTQMFQETSTASGRMKRVAAKRKGKHNKLPLGQFYSRDANPLFQDFVKRFFKQLRLISLEIGVSFSRHLRFLLGIDGMFNFQEKARIVVHEIRSIASNDEFMVQVSCNRMEPTPELQYMENVRVLQDLLDVPGTHLNDAFEISFADELGIGEGVAKEFLHYIWEFICTQFSVLPLSPSEGVLGFSTVPTDEKGFGHNLIYQVAGRVLGMSVSMACPLGACMSIGSLKRLLGKETSISYLDLEEYDPSLYAGIEYIVEGGEAEVYWSVTINGKDIDLVPGGSEKLVGDAKDRLAWANKYAEVVLCGPTRNPEMRAFSKGFHEVCPAEIVSMLSPTELRTIIQGPVEISVDQLKSFVQYEYGLSENTPMISWFWEYVATLDVKELRVLLRFWSGTEVLPLYMLKTEATQTKHEESPFLKDEQAWVIDTLPGPAGSLPNSSTCSRALHMPDFKSKEELFEKFTVALSLGSSGYAHT